MNTTRSLALALVVAAAPALIVWNVPTPAPDVPDWKRGAVLIREHGHVRTYRLPSGVLASESLRRIEQPSFALVDEAHAAAAGPRFSSSCIEDTSNGSSLAWTNYANAQADDTSYATRSLAAGQTSRFIKCQNYGFADGDVPAGQTIIGIQVTVRAFRSSGGGSNNFRQKELRLVNSAGMILATNRANTTALGTSEVSYSSGSDSDLWGASWIPSDVKDADFGVVVSYEQAGTTTKTVSVDYVTIIVFHIPPKGSLYGTGFDQQEHEPDQTVTTSGGGTVTYSASSPIDGRVSMILNSTSAGSAAEVCAPAAYVDSDLTLRGYTSAKLIFDTATLDVDECMTTLRTKIEGGRTGCYLRVCRTSTDSYSATPLFAGDETTHIDFGSFLFPPLSTARTLMIGEIHSGEDQVMCLPAIEGVEPFAFFAEMALTNCGGLACDIDTFCVGTPGTTNGENDGTFSNLKVDSWRIRNDRNPGLGRVLGITPDGTNTDEWSEVGGCSPASACVDDWASAARDSCVGETSNQGTFQERSSTGGVNRFDVTNISPAMVAGETIEAVHYYAIGCSTTSTAGAVFPLIQSNAVDRKPATSTAFPGTVSNVRAPVVMRVSHFNDPGTACTVDANCSALGTTCDTSGGFCRWNETRVNAMRAGYEKDGGNGTPSVTALMGNVVISKPAPIAANSLQDWNHDERTTVCGICDSILAGTSASVCAGEQCSDPCVDSSDCTAGATCQDGTCQTLCSTNADCSACAPGGGGLCGSQASIMNQLASAIPGATVFECAIAGRTYDFAEILIPQILDDPYTAACKLWRGEYGHCKLSGNQCTSSTTTPNECPDGGDECIEHGCDYVVDLCGGNYGIDSANNCEFSRFGSIVLGLDRTSESKGGAANCPLAASSPGQYEGPRIECSGFGGSDAARDAECTTQMGAPSLCLGYSEGHSDPVWPCAKTLFTSADSLGGTCHNDDEIACAFGNSCYSGTTGNGQPCDDDTDCPAEFPTCKNVLSTTANRGIRGTEPCGVLSGARDFSCEGGSNDGDFPCDDDTDCPGGVCVTCEFRPCKTDFRYCTVPCAAISCDDDSDCEHPTRPLGGKCVAGECTLCGAGVWNETPMQTAGMRDVMTRRWQHAVHLPGPWAVGDRQMAQTAYIEDTRGRRHLLTSYGITANAGRYGVFTPQPYYCTGTGFPGVPVLADWIAWHDAYLGATAEHFADGLRIGILSADFSQGYCTWEIGTADGLHLLPLSAEAQGFKAIGSWLRDAMPVCDGDKSVGCGACVVPCAADVDCNKPVASGPTPTPVSGACAGGVCACVSNGQCASGRCESVRPNVGAGTPTPTAALRCVGSDVQDCPAGSGLTAARNLASDTICATRTPAAGLCREEVTSVRCAEHPTERCTTDADCPSGPCSVEASYVKCGSNADCRDDGFNNGDVCASERCRQPTPG